jgi:hypothetical protein
MSFILAGLVLLLALLAGIVVDGFGVGKSREEPRTKDTTEARGAVRQIDAGLFGVNI